MIAGQGFYDENQYDDGYAEYTGKNGIFYSAFHRDMLRMEHRQTKSTVFITVISLFRTLQIRNQFEFNENLYRGEKFLIIPETLYITQILLCETT